MATQMSQDSGARKRAIPTEFAFGTDYPPKLRPRVRKDSAGFTSKVAAAGACPPTVPVMVHRRDVLF